MDSRFVEEMEAICAAIRKAGLEPYDQLYGYITRGKEEYITRTDNARARIKSLNWNMVMELLRKWRGKCMARVSTKENKIIYQTTRESLKLTREGASELLETIAPERIEKIENERVLPHPDEVLVMAEKYKFPSLCNYYCANQCPIGQQYVPEIKVKDLSQIILEMLASLNSMQKDKDRLIEITVDGKISGDELADFVAIQEQLEKISVAVETLQLWSERMLATGAIDPEQYQAYRDVMRAEQG